MTFSSVKLTYFQISGKPSTTALGENLNLFLKDAGVDFTYRRITGDEWASVKEDLVNKNVASPTMPMVEVDGKIFTKTVPTLRYLSKKLGKYSICYLLSLCITVGETDEEQYELESVADVVRDHFATLVKIFRTEDAKLIEEHFQNDTTKYLKVYNILYGQNAGPYFLGEKISYVDYLVYHILDDDFDAMSHVKEYENVRKFVDTFEQRPALAEYISSAKK